LALAVIVAVVILIGVLLVRGCGGASSEQATGAVRSSPPPALHTLPAGVPLRVAARGESVRGTHFPVSGLSAWSVAT
jgi:hypothetical protein